MKFHSSHNSTCCVVWAQDPPGEVSQVGPGPGAANLRASSGLLPALESSALWLYQTGLVSSFPGSWGFISLNKILNISSGNVMKSEGKQRETHNTRKGWGLGGPDQGQASSSAPRPAGERCVILICRFLKPKRGCPGKATVGEDGVQVNIIKMKICSPNPSSLPAFAPRGGAAWTRLPLQPLPFPRSRCSGPRGPGGETSGVPAGRPDSWLSLADAIPTLALLEREVPRTKPVGEAHRAPVWVRPQPGERLGA